MPDTFFDTSVATSVDASNEPGGLAPGRLAAQCDRTARELEGFYHSISHDLRSPLRGIEGWSAALEEDCAGQLDETARHYLGSVRTEARRLERMLEGLLQVSRLGGAAFRAEIVDLSALAGGAAQGLRESEPGRRLDFRIQPHMRAVGDPRLLDTALGHLLGNACKFTADCPVARIALTCETGVEPDSGLPARVYSVHDNGAGFDMGHAHRLFGLYQRMHPAHEFPGAGVGLCAVRRIVHRHGGCLWARSSPGEGATFSFTLGERDAP